MNYGRYQVVSEIGRGSMGVVYQAHDPQIDRLVALKVLRQDRVSSEDYVNRFLKEATAVGRLSHRGIVTVFDIGQDHGTIYIAMELLEGTPLDELLKQQKIGLDLIVRIGKDVAEALHYAHQKGIVHRDIKPANIICLENGEVKVTDFGIAHIEDPDGQQMTQVGDILGTPVYMSPEQVLGQPVDGRSDIYSLGVILYELTTGQRPFKAGNLAALFKAITSDPVDRPTSINPEIPERFSTLIMRAMARDPADRYPSGEKLADKIDASLDRTEPALIQSDNTSGKIWIVTTLGLLLCAGIGVAYYLGYFQTVPSIIKKDLSPDIIVLDEKEQEERNEPKDDSSSAVVPAGQQAESIEYISLTKEKKKSSLEIIADMPPAVKLEEPGESEELIFKQPGLELEEVDGGGAEPTKPSTEKILESGETDLKDFGKTTLEEEQSTVVIEHIGLEKEKKKISIINIDDFSHPVKSAEPVVRIPTRVELKEEIAPEVTRKELSVDTALDDNAGIFLNPAFEPQKSSDDSIFQQPGLEQNKVNGKSAAGDIQKKAEYGSIPEGWKLKEDHVSSGSIPEEPAKTDKIDQAVVTAKSTRLPVKKTGKEEAVLTKITKPVVEKTIDGGEADAVEKQHKEEVVLASLIPEKKPVQLMATLKMNSRPKGASIFIDGDYIGKTPFEFEVSAVKHEIMFQLQGHGDWKAQLDLSKGGKIPLSIRLLPE